MKYISWRTCMACALALLSEGAVSQVLQKEEIIPLVQKHVAQIEWTHNANFNLKRGVGNELSAWLVSITCVGCSNSPAAKKNEVIVLGLDREGKILCAVTSGVHLCGDKIGHGGVTSQTETISDSLGNKVQIEERYQSGGGRSISVAFYLCTPTNVCKLATN